MSEAPINDGPGWVALAGPVPRTAHFLLDRIVPGTLQLRGLAYGLCLSETDSRR